MVPEYVKAKRGRDVVEEEGDEVGVSGEFKPTRPDEETNEEKFLEDPHEWLLEILDNLEADGYTIVNKEELIRDLSYLTSEIIDKGVLAGSLDFIDEEAKIAKLTIIVPESDEQIALAKTLQENRDRMTEGLFSASMMGAFYTLEDSFRFKCDHCGNCCRGLEPIPLRPYDLYRLIKATGLTTHEFISRYASITIGGSSCLPILSLTPSKDEGTCPMFSEEKNECAYPLDKPFSCQIFPLGKTTEVADSQDKLGVETTRCRYYHPASNCQGKVSPDKAPEIKVSDWISKAKDWEQPNEEYNHLLIYIEKFPGDKGRNRGLLTLAPFLSHLFYHLDEPIIPIESPHEKISLEEGFQSRARLWRLMNFLGKYSKPIVDSESYSSGFGFLLVTLSLLFESITEASTYPRMGREDTYEEVFKTVDSFDENLDQCLLAKNLGNLSKDEEYLSIETLIERLEEATGGEISE